MKLDSVAKALGEQDPDAKIIVEGYTDSQGGRRSTRILAAASGIGSRVPRLARHRGGPRDRTGLRPDASDRGQPSAEGRANNRRVEIVVKPAAGKLIRAPRDPEENPMTKEHSTASSTKRAEGGAAGALAGGAAAGAVAGPPGALVGALLGAAAGALGGLRRWAGSAAASDERRWR